MFYSQSAKCPKPPWVPPPSSCCLGEDQGDSSTSPRRRGRVGHPLIAPWWTTWSRCRTAWRRSGPSSGTISDHLRPSSGGLELPLRHQPPWFWLPEATYRWSPWETTSELPEAGSRRSHPATPGCLLGSTRQDQGGTTRHKEGPRHHGAHPPLPGPGST